MHIFKKNFSVIANNNYLELILKAYDAILSKKKINDFVLKTGSPIFMTHLTNLKNKIDNSIFNQNVITNKEFELLLGDFINIVDSALSVIEQEDYSTACTLIKSLLSTLLIHPSIIVVKILVATEPLNTCRLTKLNKSKPDAFYYYTTKKILNKIKEIKKSNIKNGIDCSQTVSKSSIQIQFFFKNEKVSKEQKKNNENISL